MKYTPLMACIASSFLLVACAGKPAPEPLPEPTIQFEPIDEQLLKTPPPLKKLPEANK